MLTALRILIALSTIAGVLFGLIGKDFGYSLWWAGGFLIPITIYIIVAVIKGTRKEPEIHITE